MLPYMGQLVGLGSCKSYPASEFGLDVSTCAQRCAQVDDGSVGCNLLSIWSEEAWVTPCSQKLHPFPIHFQSVLSSNFHYALQLLLHCLFARTYQKRIVCVQQLADGGKWQVDAGVLLQPAPHVIKDDAHQDHEQVR